LICSTTKTNHECSELGLYGGTFFVKHKVIVSFACENFPLCEQSRGRASLCDVGNCPRTDISFNSERTTRTMAFTETTSNIEDEWKISDSQRLFFQLLEDTIKINKEPISGHVGTRPSHMRLCHPSCNNFSGSPVQEILLAYLDAFLPEKSICRTNVEVEILKGVLQNVRFAGVRFLADCRLQGDNCIFLVIDILWLHSLEELDCLCNSFLELREGGLIVFHGHRGDLGNTYSNTLGGVADALDLEGQRSHVIYKACLDESFGLAADMLICCLQELREGFEAPDEDWNGDFVESDGHVDGRRGDSALYLNIRVWSV